MNQTKPQSKEVQSVIKYCLFKEIKRTLLTPFINFCREPALVGIVWAGWFHLWAEAKRRDGWVLGQYSGLAWLYDSGVKMSCILFGSKTISCTVYNKYNVHLGRTRVFKTALRMKYFSALYILQRRGGDLTWGELQIFYNVDWPFIKSCKGSIPRLMRGTLCRWRFQSSWSAATALCCQPTIPFPKKVKVRKRTLRRRGLASLARRRREEGKRTSPGGELAEARTSQSQLYMCVWNWLKIWQIF